MMGNKVEHIKEITSDEVRDHLKMVLQRVEGKGKPIVGFAIIVSSEEGCYDEIAGSAPLVIAAIEMVKIKFILHGQAVGGENDDESRLN